MYSQWPDLITEEVLWNSDLMLLWIWQAKMNVVKEWIAWRHGDTIGLGGLVTLDDSNNESLDLWNAWFTGADPNRREFTPSLFGIPVRVESGKKPWSKVSFFGYHKIHIKGSKKVNTNIHLPAAKQVSADCRCQCRHIRRVVNHVLQKLWWKSNEDVKKNHQYSQVLMRFRRALNEPSQLHNERTIWICTLINHLLCFFYLLLMGS